MQNIKVKANEDMINSEDEQNNSNENLNYFANEINNLYLNYPPAQKRSDEETKTRMINKNIKGYVSSAGKMLPVEQI